MSTNSSLVDCTVLSPNHSGKRTHEIDTITPHCVVGQLSAESIGACFPKGREASCNYGIGTDGRVVLVVDEENRSWCSSNRANDQRAITIECASDKTYPYAFNNTVYEKLILLCADICKRYGKTKVLWLGDKERTLAYTPKSNEMVLTAHRWFAAKECPGEWLYSRYGELADRINAFLTDSKTEDSGAADENHDLTQEQFIEFVANVAVKDWKERRLIVPSLVVAQAIKESAWGKSELAKNANALFGIKQNGWTGKVYYKDAVEQNPDGTYRKDTSVAWRAYDSWEQSIIDHNDYLATRKIGNQTEPNWKGLIGESNYILAVQKLQGAQFKYATALNYGDSLIKDYIEKYNLARFDIEEDAPVDDDTAPEGTLWVVQLGAYRSRKNAENFVKRLESMGVISMIKNYRVDD